MKRFVAMYVCPLCKNNLKKITSKDIYLECKNVDCNLLGNKFPVHRNLPNFIPFGEDLCVFSKDKNYQLLNYGSKLRRFDLFGENIRNLLKIIFRGENPISKNNFRYLQNSLKSDNKILIIGGGSIGNGMKNFYSFLIDSDFEFQSIDVYLSKNINALADAHYLPYGDKYFDQVIIQAVLEHVISPRKVVSEIYRVLNIGGIVYSEVPFLQSVHEGPYDFFRFTHSGHRWLFRDFQEISSGALQGGFSSLLFISSYTISGLFRNRYIGIIIRMFLSKLCALLDRLVGKRWNIDIACGSFFLGKKENNYLNKKDASWIKNYYKVRSI